MILGVVIGVGVGKCFVLVYWGVVGWIVMGWVFIFLVVVFVGGLVVLLVGLGMIGFVIVVFFGVGVVIGFVLLVCCKLVIWNNVNDEGD